MVFLAVTVMILLLLCKGCGNGEEVYKRKEVGAYVTKSKRTMSKTKRKSKKGGATAVWEEGCRSKGVLLVAKRGEVVGRSGGERKGKMCIENKKKKREKQKREENAATF